MAANTVLAVHQKPQCGEPFAEGDWGILKDGLYLDAELAAAIAALPALLSFDVVGITGAAIWTANTVWPAHRGDGIYADLFVAKVLNRLE